MKLSIGENIKLFRKSKDITQEQLSEMLGVSCQSVSRWESGVCYPDMELLPVLSEIFEVTVDKLLGVDDIAEQKKVDEYLNRFQIAISKGQIDECISIAREGVAEYPNNYELLNKLMYALFVSGDDSGNIPNWKENMDQYDAEIVSLGERIIKYCPNQDLRLEATARLAFEHCEMGRKKIGRALYETLPSQEFCRENQIWWGLEEDEKQSFIRNKIQNDYESLRNYIQLLSACRSQFPQESVSIINKLIQIDELIYDGTQQYMCSWRNSNIHYDLAKHYAKAGDKDQVYNHLELAAKSAITFDARPETQSFSSLLLGEITVKKTDFETADSRPLCEILREKWLAHPVFDFVRDTPAFQKIILLLQTPST